MDTNLNSAVSANSHFIMVCKKMLIEQRKTLLLLTAGFLGLCAIFGLWFGFLGLQVRSEGLILYIMFGGLACALVASKMFFELTSKEGRISLLMIPASPAEKFFPRLIAILPGMILLVIIGYFVLGYSNILMIGINSEVWVPLYNPFNGMTRNDWIGSALLFSTFLFGESVFVFGSVAWPRKSFIKTCGIFALFQIVLSLSVAWIIRLIIAKNIHLEILDAKATPWIISGVITCVAIAIFYAAFAKLKRVVIK